LGSEQLPEQKIRILYCDAKGNVNSAIIDNSVYELARKNAIRMKRARKNFATVAVESAPGITQPVAVEITPEQVWALNNIMEHATKRRQLPDILKKYTGQIIELGVVKRAEYEKQQAQTRKDTTTGPLPGVLDRLPYYPAGELEVSIPIYKAEHSYPLVILKRLPPNEETSQSMQRVLILDSEGDLAIIRVSRELMQQAENALAEWEKAHHTDGCLIYSRNSDGFTMSHMEISELQRKALEAIIQHFDKTGHGEHPVSSDAQIVLARARALSSSMD
jgi:hypothetical protein